VSAEGNDVCTYRLYVVTYFGFVTIDGVWTGEWIY
jgi:hypothetical protein